MLAIERLYDAANILLVETRTKTVETAFASDAFGETSLKGLVAFLDLIEAASMEVEACKFKREEKQERFLLELRNFRGKFLEAVMLKDRSAKGAIVKPGDVERLGAIAEAVTESLDSSNTPLDRAEFSQSTRDLIAEVQDWEIEDFEKRSLLLALNLVASMSDKSATSFSDTEIRRRIKSVVAEFCVEFVHLEKQFETWFETLTRWARLGYDGAPTPLGLTNQVVKVAGLITKQ